MVEHVHLCQVADNTVLSAGGRWCSIALRWVSHKFEPITHSHITEIEASQATLTRWKWRYHSQCHQSHELRIKLRSSRSIVLMTDYTENTADNQKCSRYSMSPRKVFQHYFNNTKNINNLLERCHKYWHTNCTAVKSAFADFVSISLPYVLTFLQL